MEEVQSKKCFGDKFINAEIIDSINDEDVFVKYIGRYILMFALLMIIGVTATFLGYNFEHKFTLTMFILDVGAFLLGLLAYYKLCEVAIKNKIFKKEINPFLFFSPVIFYAVILAVSAAFTAHFTPLGAMDELNWTVELNPFFFFVIYLPMFIGLNIFYYYACLKYPSKRFRELRKQSKDSNQE